MGLRGRPDRRTQRHHSSVARLPSCMYGAVRATSRSVGVLNAPGRRPCRSPKPPSVGERRSAEAAVGPGDCLTRTVVKPFVGEVGPT